LLLVHAFSMPEFMVAGHDSFFQLTCSGHT
jgi:hypothetical protein